MTRTRPLRFVASVAVLAGCAFVPAPGASGPDAAPGSAFEGADAIEGVRFTFRSGGAIDTRPLVSPASSIPAAPTATSTPSTPRRARALAPRDQRRRRLVGGRGQRHDPRRQPRRPALLLGRGRRRGALALPLRRRARRAELLGACPLVGDGASRPRLHRPRLHRRRRRRVGRARPCQRRRALVPRRRRAHPLDAGGAGRCRRLRHDVRPRRRARRRQRPAALALRDRRRRARVRRQGQRHDLGVCLADDHRGAGRDRRARRPTLCPRSRDAAGSRGARRTTARRGSCRRRTTAARSTSAAAARSSSRWPTRRAAPSAGAFNARGAVFSSIAIARDTLLFSDFAASFTPSTAARECRALPRRIVHWEGAKSPAGYGWFRGGVDLAILGQLKGAGYEQRDAAALAAFMAEATAASAPSVVVFADNKIPVELSDKSAGPAPIRRYLEAGGKVAMLGPNPVICPGRRQDRRALRHRPHGA